MSEFAALEGELAAQGHAAPGMRAITILFKSGVSVNISCAICALKKGPKGRLEQVWWSEATPNPYWLDVSEIAAIFDADTGPLLKLKKRRAQLRNVVNDTDLIKAAAELGIALDGETLLRLADTVVE